MIKLSLTNEKINAQGGLNLIGSILAHFTPLKKLFPIGKNTRADKISDADILTTQIGLISQARIHYEDVELYRQDEAESFGLSMGLSKIPSESTLRQGLASLAKVETMTKIEGINLAILKNHQITPLEINGRFYIPNDIDVTPLDNTGSHRENVGRTYKGCDGFAPIMSNLGTQGWLLHHELRPGVQHCQKNTPEFLQRNAELLKKLKSKLKHPILQRLDAGNDSADSVKVLRDGGHFFLVKRNLRREDKVKWLGHAMSLGEPEKPREGKEVYTGSLEHLRPGGEDSEQSPLTVVYRVTRRSIDKFGQALLIDDIEVESYWTNLGESPEDVIALYHDHGASEQFHSEVKSDLNLERLPSNNYEVNKLFFALGCIAYNLLRAVDNRLSQHKDKWPAHLKKKRTAQNRRRVGSILRDIISIAGKLVSHGGVKRIKLAKGWPWSRVIIAVHKDLQMSLC